MSKSIKRLKSIKCCVAALLTAAGIMAAMPLAAQAEIAPYAENTWGVYESVLSGTQTDRIDNEVFAIEQIGGTIYVGGKFTEVRRFSTSAPITSHPYLAAFEASTGNWISTFDADLSGPVYSLQASPDGSRLFVGGEFADVQGVPNTQALVALNPATGSVDPSWKAQLKQSGRAVVYSMTFDNNWLYVGGSFNAIGGAQGVPLTTFGNAAKLNLSNGAPDLNWKPIATGGGVWGIAPAADGDFVYLAGYFSRINNVNGTDGFVGVDNNNGQTIRPGRLPHNNLNRKWYQDLVVTDNLVFIAGMEHITYVLNESNLSVRTRHSTGGTNNAGFQMGGDYQDLEVVGDRVYAACHCRNEHFADGDIYNILRGLGGTYSRQDPIRFVAAYSATTGSYDPSFTLDISASSGVWAVHGSPDGCLWLGGDITRATRADGTNQPRGAFTRHCDENFTPDTQRPSTPGGLATTSSVNSITINWNASTDNVGVTSYDVYRSATNGGAATLIGSSNNTQYVDQGLAAGDYFYYVRALDAAGNVSWRSGYVGGTVGAPADTERPSTPNGVSTAPGANSVTVSWNASTDNVGVTSYDVYRSATNGGPATVVGSSASTSFVDQGLAAGNYFYYVRALDAAGNVSWRSGYMPATVGAAADTERPSTATGFAATANGSNANLSWGAATDNVGVTGYNVYRSTNGGGYSVIATVTSPYVDSGLAAGDYSYYIRALDAAGNQGWRTAIRTVTIGGAPVDTERPSTPSGLMSNGVTASSVSLVWNASTDNVGVTSYLIIDNATGQTVATVGSNSGSVTGLNSGTSYAFFVKAVDAAGNTSWRSNVVNVTTS